MSLPNRPIRQEMYDYLPPYYREIREVQGIIDPESNEFERLNDEIRDVLAQFFVETATWGLEYWERVFGIEHTEPRTIEERRDVIKSRMRGAGVTTVTLVKEVASAYDGGKVEVTENNAEYEVIIKFVDTRGVPSNLEDTKQALREIIPAHLAIRFEFMYLVWDELDSAAITWDQLDALGLTWDELETYRFA